MSSINETNIYDVIIIGCGPSGIAAAIDLKKENIKFCIIEARDRIGGRVFTDTTTFGPNNPVDLGAQWLHHYRAENPLCLYEKSFDTEKKNYHFILRTSTTPFFNTDGQRFSSEQVDHAENVYNQICQQIKNYSLSDDQSILEFVENQLKQYELDTQIRELVDLFFGKLEQYEASNLDDLSVQSFMKSDAGIEDFNIAIPNGFGNLIRKIAQENQLPIELNSTVIRVDSSCETSVRIFTEDRRMFLCKHLLVTVPLGCLKRRTIDFIPSLPVWKQEAIDKMGVGASDKVFIEFPFSFWDTKEASIFTTSHRFRFILFQATTPIILVKLCGRVAVELENKSDEEIVDEIVAFLKKIYHNRNVPKPLRYVMTRWFTDQFSYGSYSNFNVGTNNETLKQLAQQCYDRIFWAGEHTNYDGSIGCVDSAFESGQRAARQILTHIHMKTMTE